MPLYAGLLSVTFRRLPAREVVDLAADAGLAGIEWGGDVHVPHGDLGTARDVRRMCDDHGLRVTAYGSYLRAGEASADNPSVRAVIDTAVSLGAPTVRVWPGTAGSARTPDRSGVVNGLATVCDVAAAAGLTVSTEFHADTLTDDPDSAVALFTAVDRPNLRTFWQPPNGMAVAEALAGLRKVGRWVSNVHAFHWWPTSDTRHPLADGGDRWPAYLSAIAGLGQVDRYASLEFVVGDDIGQFRRDAATLIAWVRSAGTDGAP